MVRIKQIPKKSKSALAITLTQLILEKLLELGEVTLDAFFPAKYPAARLWRGILGLDAEYEFSPRTFSAILSRLRQEGLVSRRGSHRRAYWSLTPQGKVAMAAPQGRDPFAELPPRDQIPRLVAFDIPERERAKRDAIRRELLACDYHPLQRSVWIGYRSLPEDFLELLDALNLRKCVHILTVRNAGTIEVNAA